MEEVESVANVPDYYNCTFEVEMKSGGLPCIDRWQEQFKAVVGEGFLFRGVEITVDGRLARDGDQLILHVPGLSASLRLAPLKHKLQWNFRKRAARQPEPAESEAYQQLRSRLPRGRKAFVQVIGPLLIEETGPIIEVREFYYLQR
jgi:hypothetical protein